MFQNISWIERLSALHRSAMRRFAQQESLQLVHLEILTYLLRCNRYSDTTQALSEYLGQTKGSISQSIGCLESDGFIKRHQDGDDKRVFHLLVTTKGRNLIGRFDASFQVPEMDKKVEASFAQLLLQIQTENDMKGFGVCKTCRYNQNPRKNEFICGLTKEKLTIEDTQKICREHEVA